MKRQMKDSGIEWIGQIPEEWHVSKIKNVYIVILGKMLSPSQTQKDQTLENYLCAANIKWSGVDTSIQKQMWFSESDKAEYKLHEGDILIMEGGLAGTSCKYRGEMAPCFIQNSVHCCRAKSNYSNQFLYYWMNVVYNSKYIENICNKATIQHYTKEKVMNTPFLICSSLEQEKIVSYLDRKCAQIDAIISKQQQIIEKLKEYKLSVITEAVTKGLDPNVPMKDSGVEWIGNVPETWNVMRFGRCATIKSNLVDPSQYSDYPQISPESIEKDSNHIIEYKTVKESGVISWNHLFFKGQIIYSKIRPLLNKVTIAPFNGLCSADMYPIETNNNADFIVHMMLSIYFTAQVGQVTETRVKMPKINQNELNAIIVAIPPLKEQKKIADYLHYKNDTIEKMINKRQNLIDKLLNYKKALIYETVTGKKEV